MKTGLFRYRSPLELKSNQTMGDYVEASEFIPLYHLSWKPQDSIPRNCLQSGTGISDAIFAKIQNLLSADLAVYQLNLCFGHYHDRAYQNDFGYRTTS
jgi:hypothetical protein